MSVFFRQNKDGSRRYYVRREFRGKEYIWPKRGEGPWRNRWQAQEREAEVEHAVAMFTGLRPNIIDHRATAISRILSDEYEV